MTRSLLFTLCLVVPACTKAKEAPDSPAPAAKKDEATASKAPADANKGEAKPTADAHGNDTPAQTATAQVGQPAPDFTLTDLDGKEHKLSQYRGKTVVLEWFNPQCPFVKFAHSEGPLVDMASTQTEKGIVWLAINSGGPGRQGHGEQANRDGASTFKMTHPILIDEDGAIGHTYGAEKTPHMYVIDEKGTLVYRGSIDNAPFGEVDGGGDKVNFVDAALTSLAAGEPIATADRPAYGCTVKYAKKS